MHGDAKQLSRKVHCMQQAFAWFHTICKHMCVTERQGLAQIVKLTWRHMHSYLALPGEVLVQVVFGHFW